MSNKDRIYIGEWNGIKRYRYPKKEEENRKKQIERQKKKPIKKKKINNFSVKRQKQNKEYSIVRKEYLEENPNCEADLENCTYEATEIHHKKGRIGDLLTNKEFFLASCHGCHEWIELNPIEAKKKKLSLHRFIKR